MTERTEQNYEGQKERILQLANQSRYLDLRKYTAEILAQNPEFSQALLFNGLSYCKMGDSSGFAIMERALAMEPENAYYFFMVAHAYATNSHKNPERSLQLIGKAIELKPYSTQYRKFAASLLMQERQFKEAMRYLKEALELDADDPDLMAKIAYCNAQFGLKKEAIEAIEEAIKQDPDNARIHKARADIYYDFCYYKKSREAMQFCLLRNPDANIRYTYLMAHHGFVSGLFFRPQVIKPVQYGTIALGCIAGAMQAAALLGSLEQRFAMLSNYIVSFFIFYLFIRGFVSAFLIWCMKKNEREMMLLGRTKNLILIYAAVFVVAAAFISDLFFRSNGSHAVFWILLHVVMLITIVLYRRLLSKGHKLFIPLYFTLCVAATLLLLKYDFMVFSGLMLFLTGYIIGPFRNYFIRMCKINLGFDKESEDDFSF